jgi:hypothetical protein
MYAIAFGNLFNDIVVRRFDIAKNELHAFTVPISYSPKRKWEAQQANSGDRPVAAQVPRLGFDLTSRSYDSTRKLSPLNKLTFKAGPNDMYSSYMPQPYKLNWELYALSKNMDDMCQIDEQIIPFFTQDFTQSITLIPQLPNHKFDIGTRHVSTTPQDVYDGELKQRQYLLWTWNFEMDAWYFGPVERSGVIKRVQIDLIPVPGSGKITSDEVTEFGRQVRIEVTPGLTADGKPTTNKADSIDFHNINSTDDYGFCTDITEYHDGLKYSPKLGIDK